VFLDEVDYDSDREGVEIQEEGEEVWRE